MTGARYGVMAVGRGVWRVWDRRTGQPADAFWTGDLADAIARAKRLDAQDRAAARK